MAFAKCYLKETKENTCFYSINNSGFRIKDYTPYKKQIETKQKIAHLEEMIKDVTKRLKDNRNIESPLEKALCNYKDFLKRDLMAEKDNSLCELSHSNNSQEQQNKKPRKERDSIRNAEWFMKKALRTYEDLLQSVFLTENDNFLCELNYRNSSGSRFRDDSLNEKFKIKIQQKIALLKEEIEILEKQPDDTESSMKKAFKNLYERLLRTKNYNSLQVLSDNINSSGPKIGDDSLEEEKVKMKQKIGHLEELNKKQKKQLEDNRNFKLSVEKTLRTLEELLKRDSVAENDNLPCELSQNNNSFSSGCRIRDYTMDEEKFIIEQKCTHLQEQNKNLRKQLDCNHNDKLSLEKMLRSYDNLLASVVKKKHLQLKSICNSNNIELSTCDLSGKYENTKSQNFKTDDEVSKGHVLVINGSGVKPKNTRETKRRIPTLIRF